MFAKTNNQARRRPIVLTQIKYRWSSCRIGRTE